MNTIMIAFGGKYRPLCFQAETIQDAANMAASSIQDTADCEKLTRWIRELSADMARMGYASSSAEHCGLSVAIYRRAHDRWLDSITSSFPAYPGADYSRICNS